MGDLIPTEVMVPGVTRSQIRQAYLRLQSVQEELERRQAAFHEGLSRVSVVGSQSRLVRVG